jgi:hypothetical protein
MTDPQRRPQAGGLRRIDGNHFGHKIITSLAMEFARTALLG